MTSSAILEPQVFQTFKTQNDKPHPSRPTCGCAETGKRYILWSDIQKAFVNINYLQDRSVRRVLFMINKCGDLYLPLRVEHHPDEAYTTVYKVPNQDVPALECLYYVCEQLYERLENAPNMARALFLQIAANIRYHHALLLGRTKKLDAAQVMIQIGRKSREEIQDRLSKLEQKVPDWNYRNICFNMFYGAQTKWDYVASKLFIVLPSDVESWDDRNPSTHNFRLYFLCDNQKHDMTSRSMPQHVHLANHPGYNLLRTQDFFEEYGDYVLRVLRMVKHGCTIGSYDIPPMDPAKILWKCDPDVIGNHVINVNIAYLVDKAIAYLEEHSPPEWIMEPGLTCNQSVAIKDFLDVKQGENTEGNLHRHIESDQRVTWRCKPHNPPPPAQSTNTTSSPALSDPLTLQTCKTPDDWPTVQETRICTETRKFYVYWRDIERDFVGISYLQDSTEERALLMIDKHGNLYRPLRIAYNPAKVYTVVKLQCNNQPLLSLKRLFEMCMHLYGRLESASNVVRPIFQQLVVNTRHYHALLQKEMDRLDMAGIMVLVDGKNREQIQKQLHKLEQKVPKWSDQNVYLNMFYGEQTKWDYATSRLFFVLPSDLDSWRDADPSTHQFRLYFLCDNRKEDVTFSGMPQYVHLFNHPGYNLLRPQVFLEKYGDYVLRVLQMLKNGCPIAIYEIPPIDSGKILWRCDPTITSSHFTQETFAFLVDKAIAHIQDLSLPKWIMNPWLTRNQSAAIKDFLDVKKDENTEGNLHRHIDSDQRVSWKCQWHKQQHIDPKPLATLQEFVQNHGGDVNMQQTTLTVVLRSPSVADQFWTLLKATQQIFDLNLILDLRLTREYLRDLYLDLAQSKAITLDIDGVTLEAHPQGCVDYALNLFADNVVPKSDLKLITLNNYPRPQERCLHLGKYSLWTSISTSRPARSWVELKSELEKFGDMVSLARTGIDCNNAAEMLRSLLLEHGYPLATVVTIHESGWSTVFKPEEGGVIEVYSMDAACPLGVHFSGSLRKVTVELTDLNFDRDFFHLAQTNKALQELHVSYGGSNLLYYIESIVKMWHESSSPFTLTLIDRMGDSRGRVVAHMTIRGRGNDGSGSTLDVDPVDSTHSTQNDDPVPPNVHFSKYDGGHIFSPLSDFSVSILDKATEQHPSALKLLSLDTSQLSRDGLATASKILNRSDLEHLNIVCTPFSPNLSSSIERVLDSVQSNALKSLVFSGSNIDGWIKLWPLNDTPKLIHLGIRGAGSAQQELSHASVLAIHQMVYASPLVDLKFENVELQHRRDWELIVGGLERSRSWRMW